MTYREALHLGRRTLSFLEDGALDARLLLEEACGIGLETLLAEPDRELRPEQESRYRRFLERRAVHEPLAMIVGHSGFMGLSFRVTRDVLIPEQDTEVLVERAIADAQTLRKTRSAREQAETGGTSRGAEEKEPEFRILDLCTGSGCILLSLLHYLPGRVSGTGCDLSEAALRVAAENARNLGLEDKAGFCRGDLFDALGQTQPFDLIVSNPPYIPRNVIPTLPEEVRLGEPYMALCGGEDGLDFYRRILPQARKWLRGDGEILLETGYDQGGAVAGMAEAAGFAQVQVLQDYGGNDRVVIGR